MKITLCLQPPGPCRSTNERSQRDCRNSAQAGDFVDMHSLLKLAGPGQPSAGDSQAASLEKNLSCAVCGTCLYGLAWQKRQIWVIVCVTTSESSEKLTLPLHLCQNAHQPPQDFFHVLFAPMTELTYKCMEVFITTVCRRSPYLSPLSLSVVQCPRTTQVN